MWTYSQSAGTLLRDGKLVSRGYSGHGRGKNNASMQAAKGVGPIPRGQWTIGEPYDSQNTGPYTLGLAPKAGTDTEGRDQFRIHGDSIAHPGEASHGCIILPRAVRVAIVKSGDPDLLVIA